MCCALFFSETARNKCDVLRPILLFPKAHEQPIRCVMRSAFPKLSFDPRHMLRPLCPKHVSREPTCCSLLFFYKDSMCCSLLSFYKDSKCHTMRCALSFTKTVDAIR
jgi:hypothetical protein